VKFKIEKNLSPKLLDKLHRVWPGMSEQLLADFEHADISGEKLDNLFGLL
jgi:hypothetical protein